MFAEPCIIYLLFAIIGIHTVDNALLQSSVLSPSVIWCELFTLLNLPSIKAGKHR